MIDSAPDRITIDRVDDGWVIGDDEGEFARAGSITLALRYVEDLMYGPGTGPRAMMRALSEPRPKAKRVRWVNGWQKP